MKRLSIHLTGRVQGVGLRYHAFTLARDYQLTGWVRNNIDGSVSLQIQGKTENIQRFLDHLKSPLGFIQIEKTQIEPIELENDSEFKIR